MLSNELNINTMYYCPICKINFLACSVCTKFTPKIVTSYSMYQMSEGYQLNYEIMESKYSYLRSLI